MIAWQAVSAGADTDSSVLRKKVLTEITSQYLVKSPNPHLVPLVESKRASFFPR